METETKAEFKPEQVGWLHGPIGGLRVRSLDPDYDARNFASMYVPIGTAFRIEKLFSFEGVFKHEVFATYEDPPEEIRNCWVKLTRKLGARDYWTFIGTSGQIEDVHLCKVATDSLFKRCGFRNSFWVTIKEIKDDKPV